MKFCVLMLGLIAFVGGCAAKKADSDPYPTVSDFCHAWSKDACSSAVVSSCSGGLPTTTALTEACIEKQQAFCEGLVPVTGYSSGQADACLSAVGAAYSDGKLTALEFATVRHLGSPCNHLIKGPKGDGESCTQDNDCDTPKSFQCVMKAGVGACAVPVEVDNGTSCTAPAATCKPGFYCDSEHCVQSKAPDAKCSADYECASGLICDGAGDAGTETGKCATRVNSDTCSADVDCATAFCDIPIGQSTGKCAESINLGPSDGICGDL